MLFSESEVFGTFKGFSDKGLEFAADIIAPYNASMLDRPQLGQFLLIELGSPEEASLGRITRFVPTGLLTSAEGEDYVNTMQRRQQPVPEDLKEQRLKYRVQIKLLGAVRVNDKEPLYVPSQRRLPHLGARVALPSAKVLSALCRLSRGKTELGDYVLGEFIYCGAKNTQKDPVFRTIDPHLPVMFDIQNLVSRRSVVFARAGYGKSNLIKFLVAELYKHQPKTESGRDVGTLIFDPDGEYFWPDVVNARPGLCDVPQLSDKLVVFTNRTAPSPYYGSWKAGEVRLDIRDLPARDVIGIAVSAERQEHQNVLKLKSLPPQNWRELVDLMQNQGLQASDTDIGRALGYTTPTQVQASAAEIAAARSNMYGVVRTLHDPNSRVLSGTLTALQKGGVVVIDISLLSSGAGNMLAGLIIRRIFSHNQENFTGGLPIIPTIMVLEEAQSVLGRNLMDGSPFVEWVKEGRKYDLGAILITQQPGSMAPELLSQADNWFCFHLLSEGDAGTLGKYNSHFSDDILAHLIGEPIRGNCYMWSAPHQPFVLPVRIHNFEELYGKKVQKAKDAIATAQTMAKQIIEKVSQAEGRLAAALIEQLKQANVKYVEIPDVFPNGVAGTGVGSGQLYHLINEIKETADVTPVDELKVLLFNRVFGEGNWVVARQAATNKEYYCARKDDWRNLIGVDPKIR